MARNIASFVCGLVFGIGLLISGMTEPSKVIGFLDIFGAWDATLAFVMAGGVAVASAGFALARARNAPVLAPSFAWPARQDIDAPLVVGSALFGVGWGLAGICPGPALVNLAGLSAPIIVFVATMLLGMFGYELWQRRNAGTDTAKSLPAGAGVATPSDG